MYCCLSVRGREPQVLAVGFHEPDVIPGTSCSRGTRLQVLSGRAASFIARLPPNPRSRVNPCNLLLNGDEATPISNATDPGTVTFRDCACSPPHAPMGRNGLGRHISREWASGLGKR